MTTISLVAKSGKPSAKGSTMFEQKNLLLKAAAGALLAVPFAAIALSMARMILAGL